MLADTTYKAIFGVAPHFVQDFVDEAEQAIENEEEGYRRKVDVFPDYVAEMSGGPFGMWRAEAVLDDGSVLSATGPSKKAACDNLIFRFFNQ